ncbi:acyl-ACP--UDP-N-acetylglucosamine O-acyltransferase [soil metagenome]
MNLTVHKTAVIADGAQIHETAEIGPYVVIGPNVKIGKGTKIGAHAVIDGHTTIGEDCTIFVGATIGLEPQDLGYKGEPTGVQMGDRNTVREYVTIHRATKDGVTVIGDDCFFMAYSHIAHDCKVGNGVILANNSILAGHVQVGDYVILAGVCVIHQHCRLGRMLLMSGLSATRQDLPPFAMCDGRPTTVRGVNAVGLKRRQIPPANRKAIKEAYRIIYRSDANLTKALAQIEKELEPFPEILEIVEFYRSSKRGVVSRRGEKDNEQEDP